MLFGTRDVSHDFEVCYYMQAALEMGGAVVSVVRLPHCYRLFIQAPPRQPGEWVMRDGWWGELDAGAKEMYPDQEPRDDAD